MPILPPAVPLPVWQAVVNASAHVRQEAAPSIEALGEEIIVSALRVKRDLVAGTVTFSGNVRVLYGPTTILAETLIVSEAKQEATAVGTVRILDPDGQLTAESLTVRFEVGKESASFEKMSGQIAGAQIRSGKAVLSKTEWTFEDIEGTPCRNNPPLLGISGRQLVIVPGKRGYVRNLSVKFFGLKVATLPKYSFSLDRRVRGVAFPSLAYRQSEGLGIGWGAQLLLGPQTAGTAFFSVFKKSYPTYGVAIARSLLKPEESDALITPADDLSERFTYSWFDTIEVSNPLNETKFLTERRSSLGLQSQWNRGTPRSGLERFSKAVDMAYEFSGKHGPLLSYGQVRAQSIRRQGDPFINRGLASVAVATEPYQLGNGLALVDRIEAAKYAGGNDFGWIRGSVGLIYLPNKQISLGIFGVRGSNHGQPDLAIDSLDHPDGVHFRADLDLGPTKFRYLTKRDDHQGWYDQEFYVSQVIGCLEAFVVSRKSPNEYRFGIKIRIDQFVDLLQKRNLERSTVPGKKISIQ